MSLFSRSKTWIAAPVCKSGQRQKTDRFSENHLSPIMLKSVCNEINNDRYPIRVPVVLLQSETCSHFAISVKSELGAEMAAQTIENMAAAMGMGVLYNGYLKGLFNSSPE